HERVDGQFGRSLKEDTGLADVLDGSDRPSVQILDPITHGQVQMEAQRPRYTRGFLLASPSPGTWLGNREGHALGPAHGSPVVLIFNGTQQANLVVVAIGGTPGPGELVGTAPESEDIHEFLRHDELSGEFPDRHMI